MFNCDRNFHGGPGMYFSSGISTKIDSWGRHGTPYSPHHWEGTSSIQTGRRGKDGFDDFNNGREPYSAYYLSLVIVTLS